MKKNKPGNESFFAIQPLLEQKSVDGICKKWTKEKPKAFRDVYVYSDEDWLPRVLEHPTGVAIELANGDIVVFKVDRIQKAEREK